MWYFILGLLLAIYILINVIIPGRIDGVIGAYIIQPLLWIFLALVTILIARHEGFSIWKFKKIRKWELGRSPVEAALLVGGFQVSLLVIAGLSQGWVRVRIFYSAIYWYKHTFFWVSSCCY